MPPRKSRRLVEAETASAEGVSDAAQLTTITHSQNLPNPNPGLRLIQLPSELFDAIIENYATLPTTYYHDTADILEAKHYERIDALTALSQTCRALREITLPRLWARLDICRVPSRARLTWFKYTMLALERKSNGIAASPVRNHVRTLTLLFSKSNADAALAALWSMLPKLPNLRTIHVLHCKTPGFANSLADVKLQLPNVTTLFLPSEASVLQRICPNATHVRCVGGSGSSLVSVLTTKTEAFDGMVDWTDLKLVGRLVKKAPNLRTLELRRPVHSGPGIESQSTAPAEWAQVIPKLAALKNLTELILTFPAVKENPSDPTSVTAARTLLRAGARNGGEEARGAARDCAALYEQV
ncbi:hypothetical protein FB451DRAFT_1125488 [Mycena latifolia]|nr:hypothetical protein FB451DRAFT_1125488 [Mycena latifolia]